MSHQTTRLSRPTKMFLLIAVLLLPLVAPSCSGGQQQPSETSCKDQENLALENTCFAATILAQGSPFPNPVQAGGVVKLKMKIGAVNSQFAVIPASISTKVINAAGALVHQETQPPLQSTSSNFQDVPVWTNINVAAGTYTLEVTVSVGECGYKKICLSGDKRVVVVK